MKALLALADGRVFEGYSFGAPGETTGEVVFNTSLMGYQEVLTDPSYKGQIVVMTYPLIGNYGLNDEDVESRRPFVEGFVVKECSPYTSNWRARKGLDEYLKDFAIVGIQGIDTRALTKHIRDRGSQEGVISTTDLDRYSLTEKAKKSPGLVGKDLVREVTCENEFTWSQGIWVLGEGYTNEFAGSGDEYSIIAYDCGIKYNILRMMKNAGFTIKVVPAKTSAKDILAQNPDGVFISNGPGDPEGVSYVVRNVRNLIGKKPIFGICFGHQILSLALGAKTYKLKFGHHGGNQPVKDLETGKVEITSQNHNFAVDSETLPHNIEVTHINLNDHTVEGIRHKDLPIFSIQYHPEASPGPHDAGYLFARFREMIKSEKR